jgi:hypothetical protein
MFTFKLLHLLLQIRIGVRNAVGKIDELIFDIKPILKREGIEPIEILSTFFVYITKLMPLRKLKGLSRLNPLFRRRGISVNPHPHLIREFTP